MAISASDFAKSFDSLARAAIDPVARMFFSPRDPAHQVVGADSNAFLTASGEARKVPPVPDLSLSRIERGSAAGSNQPAAAVVTVDPSQALASVGHSGWLQDISGRCWVWDSEPQENESATWTGKCDRNYRATGPGTLQWLINGKPVESYDVQMIDGKMNGHGVGTSEGIRYEGDYRNNVRSGVGILKLPDGSQYEGGFLNDEMSGHGILQRADGENYDGGWLHNKREGRGVLKLTDGTIFEGEFHDGGIGAHGVKKWPNGTRYEGEWKDGQMTGHGVKEMPNGTRYEGEFKNGQMNGHGVQISPNGVRVEGEFRDGKPVSPPPSAKGAAQSPPPHN